MNDKEKIEEGNVIDQSHVRIKSDLDKMFQLIGNINAVVADEAFHEHKHIEEEGNIKVKHSHSHTHENTRAVLNRMARLIGHLQATKRMIEDGRDCSEVLIQLAAVDAAIKSVSRVILEDHLKHCIVEAIEQGDEEALDNINKAIEQFMK